METLIFKDDTLTIDWVEEYYKDILDEMAVVNTNVPSVDILKESVRSIIQYGNFAEVIENMMERSITKQGETYTISSRFKAKRAVNYAKILTIQFRESCTKEFIQIYLKVNCLIHIVEYILVYSHKKISSREIMRKKSIKSINSIKPINDDYDYCGGYVNTDTMSQRAFDDYPAYFPKGNKTNENKD